MISLKVLAPLGRYCVVFASLSLTTLCSGGTTVYGFSRDTVPPTAQITVPGPEVSGSTVSLSIQAEDNRLVDQITVFVDTTIIFDQQFKRTKQVQMDINWDTTQFTDGEHLIQVTVSDRNNLTSDSKVVNVSNHLPPPNPEPEPTLEIASPLPNTSLSDNVTLTVSATHASGVKKFKIDLFHSEGDIYSLLELLNTPPPNGSLPTHMNISEIIPVQSYGKGAAEIRVRAYDASGSAYMTRSVNFLIEDNAPPPPPPEDTEKPTVSIESPISGATITGKIDIKALANDNQNINRVEFVIDQEVLFTKVETPYTWSEWDSSSISDGSHVISAVAYDNAGNSATASIGVTIQNQNAEMPRKVKVVYKHGLPLDVWDANQLVYSNDQEMRFVAENYDIFILPPGIGDSKVREFKSTLDTYLSENSEVDKKLIRYVKIGGLHSNTSGGGEDHHWTEVINHPLDLFLRGPSGEIIRHNDNNWYFIDILEPTKRLEWEKILAIFFRDKKTYNKDTQSISEFTDGLFWDNAASDIDPFMVDPGCSTTACPEGQIPSHYNDREYYSSVDDILRVLKNGSAFWDPSGWNPFMIINTHLGYQPEDLRGFELLTDQENSKGADGVMFEGFALKVNGTVPHRPRRRFMTQLRDFEHVTYNLDKEAYAMNYLYLPEYCNSSVGCGGQTIERAHQIRLYAFASYLLVQNQNSFLHVVAYNHRERVQEGKSDVPQYYPEYAIDLGAPVQTECTIDGNTVSTPGLCGDNQTGLLMRRYEKGLVLLNPDWEGDSNYAPEGPNTITYSLPELECPAGHECAYEELSLIGGGSLNRNYQTDTATPDGMLAWTKLSDQTAVTLPRTRAMILRTRIEPIQ